MYSSNINNFRFLSWLIALSMIFIALSFTARVYAAAPSVALDWQADTYVPAWYTGKKLPTPGSAVTVSATLLAPEVLTAGTKTKTPAYKKYYYKWYMNGQRISDWKLDASTFSFKAGNSSAVIEMRLGKKITTTLPFTNKKIDSISELGQYHAIIRSYSPSVVVYKEENGVLEGGQEVSIRSGAEKNFVALPYFYPIASIGDLKFDWSFLGNILSGANLPLQASDKPNELLLKIKDGSGSPSGGSAPLSVRVTSYNGAQSTKSVQIKIQEK